MGIRIIAEMGSTHAGKIEYAKEAVDRCVDLGVDAIKFQLFPKTDEFLRSGNVWLDPDLYIKIADYAAEQGLACSASVFDDASFDFLLATRPPFIKFAYSQKHRKDLIEQTILDNIEPIVSCDVMTIANVPKLATRLYCIPAYPVQYMICFDNLFPKFAGFSDHTLGFDQTLEAIYQGAQIIEKHITLNKSDVRCPDSYFALSMPEFSSMVHCIRQIEKGKPL